MSPEKGLIVEIPREEEQSEQDRYVHMYILFMLDQFAVTIILKLVMLADMLLKALLNMTQACKLVH